MKTKTPVKKELFFLYLRDIDAKTKKAFKVKCANEGVSMTKKMEQLMKDYVAEDADGDEDDTD